MLTAPLSPGTRLFFSSCALGHFVASSVRPLTPRSRSRIRHRRYPRRWQRCCSGLSSRCSCHRHLQPCHRRPKLLLARSLDGSLALSHLSPQCAGSERWLPQWIEQPQPALLPPPPAVASPRRAATTTCRAAAELAVSYCDVVACDAERFCVSPRDHTRSKDYFWCLRLSGYRLWRPSASGAAQAPWDGACGACGAVTPPPAATGGSPVRAGEYLHLTPIYTMVTVKTAFGRGPKNAECRGDPRSRPRGADTTAPPAAALAVLSRRPTEVRSVHWDHRSDDLVWSRSNVGECATARTLQSASGVLRSSQSSLKACNQRLVPPRGGRAHRAGHGRV